ncbi:prolyl oligopeptidase family serine peptidase [Kribbella sp. NPDC006257]|uniref:prolyl oligopeptidase family serine peptidase n=1 Tax=Kribbella sp. NPDC006257 TaxID=3156738 RepID=UPI0033BEF4F7
MRNYPDAERLAGVESLHGHRIPDPYRWLEDAADPRTQSWQAVQDELWLTHAFALPARSHFRSRVAALSDVTVTGTPTWRGSRRFFVQRTPGQEHPVLVVADPEPRVLVDPVDLDASGNSTLDRWQPSPDGRLVAFQISRGDENSVLRILDVDTGALAEEPITRCRYSPVAWCADSRSFYFVRANRLCLHRVGHPENVQVLAGEASYGLEISAKGVWLVISVSVADRNDLWLVDLERPVFMPVVVQQGLPARTAATVGPDGRLYLATTLDAPSGRICVADPERPNRWTELVAEQPDAPLGGLAILDDVLLVARTRHAISELTSHDLRTGEPLHQIPLPGPGSLSELTTRPNGGHEAWFTYTDSITPPTIHRYSSHTHQVTRETATTLLGELTREPARNAVPARDPVPAPHAVPAVVAEGVDFLSADGTALRMTVLGLPGSGSPRPTILYGYGGFGLSLVPAYSAFALAWVEAGGLFVTANVRGGGEQGGDWHRAGTLGSKQNVIDDFLAAAETLIATGRTTPAQLGICGESNGGLLVGAALSQRPELFAAAVCSAPVLDMVRYQHSGLGASWLSEYGSSDDPEQLSALLAYSPYHRVVQASRPVDYPAVLLTIFGADSRVDPMHARKMCAALQHASRSRPVLLRSEPDAGHLPGATGRGTELAADLLAFLAFHTGLTP